MEFEDVIKTRTSIRTYLDKPVENEKLQFVLECTRRAPSWANRQCWHFIVITDKETIRDLSKATIINHWLKHVPVLIVACGDPRKSGSSNNIDYCTVDVSIALEHLVLAATDKGLGTCWIAAFDGKKVREILRIPKHIQIVALTPLGYPAEKKSFVETAAKVITQSKKRKSLDEIIHQNRW